MSLESYGDIIISTSRRHNAVQHQHNIDQPSTQRCSSELRYSHRHPPNNMFKRRDLNDGPRATRGKKLKHDIKCRLYNKVFFIE